MSKTPVFEYTSVCCDAHASKPPCERSVDDKKANRWSDSTLGTWRCDRCTQACAVKRTRIPQQ